MSLWTPKSLRATLAAGFVGLLCFAGMAVAVETTTRSTDEEMVTGRDVPVELLEFRIKHLSAEELTSVADDWMAMLRDTVYQLQQKKIEVWRENQLMQAASAEVETDQEDVAARARLEVEHETELKEASLERVAELREQRVQLIDRLNVVLDELSAKLGMTAEGEEHESLKPYRLYVDAVKGLKLDVSDTQSTRASLVAWLKSTEGGLRWAKHLGEFLAIVVGFWLLSIILGRLMGKVMSLSSGASQILRKFVADSVRRIVFFIGLLLGLATLEIDITPLIAVIGAAGFVIAFALQNTLSNFASGLMIMAYKPFDIGDFLETPSVSGKVKSMTLVTTNMMTPDNKLLVVPNNELWGNVITNVTGSKERRVDLVFGIGYDDDIALAERVLAEVVSAHPMVLDEPEPVISVSELADSSVNLICRPWVKTPDYWTVRRELTRAVKERFDAEGITIPFPQREVHHRTPSPEPISSVQNR